MSMARGSILKLAVGEAKRFAMNMERISMKALAVVEERGSGMGMALATMKTLVAVVVRGFGMNMELSIIPRSEKGVVVRGGMKRKEEWEWGVKMLENRPFGVFYTGSKK